MTGFSLPTRDCLRSSRLRLTAPLLLVLGLAACGQQAPAPVTFTHRDQGTTMAVRQAQMQRNVQQAPVQQMAAADTVGGDVMVQQGDTLYGLARRHNVSPRAMIEANGLEAPYTLQPGQQLRLPGGAAPVMTASARPAPVTAAPQSYTPSVPRQASSGGFPLSPAPTAPALTGTGVAVEELPPLPGQAAAASAPAQQYQAQSVAAAEPQLPAGYTPSPAAVTAKPQQAPAAKPQAVAQAPLTEVTVPSQAAQAPIQHHSAPEPEPQVAAAPVGAPAQAMPQAPIAVPTPVAAPMSPPSMAGIPQASDEPPPRSGRTFAWPVRGRILSTFGQKADGMHNDGINIAARSGAPVIAAENGVVVYSGSEVRGFGNLLLVRHADGWMTAYAHLDRLLVQKGQKVTRGQAIATVGSSGGADQPQLHFEIRKGTQAVDPAKFLTVATLQRRDEETMLG